MTNTTTKLGTYFTDGEAIPVPVSLLDIPSVNLTPETMARTVQQIADEFGGSIPKAEKFVIRCLCAADGYTPEDIDLARLISAYIDWLDGE